MQPKRLAPVIIFAAACRIGGASGDPSLYIQFADAADDQATQGGPEAAVDGASDGSELSTEATSDLDSAALEASSTMDPTEAAREGGDATACAAPPSIPVCNPVQNTGCFLLQCDVDMTMSTATGQCVGGGLASPGTTCMPSSGSELCQAQSTCFAGTCRRLCFCDSDCPVGECCTDTAGTSGFSLCAPCH